MEVGVLAHVEWVVPHAERFAPAWHNVLRVEVLAALTAVAVAAWAWNRVGDRAGRRVQARADRWLRPYAPAGPSVVRTAVALSLLALTLTGQVLAPGAHAPEGLLGWFVLGTQGVVAVGLALDGRRTRWGLALVALVVVAALVTDVSTLLEGAHLVGVGVAAVAWSVRGAWSPGADRALRTGLGVSLVVAAYTEKLGNPELAAEVLERFPQLDLPAALGLPVTAEVFVVAAAAVEVLLGLVLVLGRGRALTSLVVIGPFVATLALFGLPELVGHLPIYAVLLVVAVTPLGAPVPQLRRPVRRPESVPVAAGTGR